MRTNIKLYILGLLLVSIPSFAQETEEESNHHTESSEHFHHHSIGILLSHTLIGTGVNEDGGSKTISVPSWAINYDYHFNEKWSLGLHSDIIAQSYVVEDERAGEEFLERETPIASVIVGAYKITEAFALELGAGMEFEKNENFGLVRIGAEYGIEIPQLKMEAILGIDYDILFEAYDAFNIGIGLAKFF